LKTYKFTGILFFISLITSGAYSQSLSDSLAKSFINGIINNSPELEQYVQTDELQLSKRLGISYNDTRYKFLISNDLEPDVKNKLRIGALTYEYNIKLLKDDYSALTIQIPSQNIKNEYYFYKSKLVSKPSYFAKDWTLRESKYFEFHLNNPKLINEYSINKLDSFVDNMLTLLAFNEDEINRLKKEKIHYYLCGDENEIELLTNYKARGLYYMPYDYIISTYNCHYHELLHLLMNYKLQTVSLYTLPLLQEGFAVAFGGRGGQNPDVLFGMGAFLAQSNVLDYKSLLNKPDFYKVDPSMSYPSSGLYVKYLINTIGIKKFIELYKEYSTDSEKIDGLNINISELPPDSGWQNYLNSPELNNTVIVSGFIESDYQKFLVKTDNISIYENGDKYLFKIKGKIGLNSKKIIKNYTSNLFNELLPKNNYNSENYLIAANAEEVSVYNLYSNDLVAKYVRGFTTKNDPVIQKDGFFIFTLNKNIFEEQIQADDVEYIGL
jgi:hypothetical protein